MYDNYHTLFWSKLIFVLMLLLTNGIHAKKSTTAKTPTKKDSTLAPPLLASLDEPDIPDGEFKATSTVTTGEIAPGITATYLMTTAAPSDGKITHKPSAKNTKKSKKAKKKDSTIPTIPPAPLDDPDVPDVEFKTTLTVTTGGITSGIKATYVMTTTIPSEVKITHKHSAKKSKKEKKEKKKDSTFTTLTVEPLDESGKPDGEFKTETVTGGIDPGITATHFETTTVPSEGKNIHKPSAKKSKKAKKEKKKDSNLTTTPLTPLDDPDIPDVEFKATPTATTGGITSVMTATHLMTTTVLSDGKITHKPSAKKSKKAKKEKKKDSIFTTFPVEPLDEPDKPDSEFKTESVTTGVLAPGITGKYFETTTVPPEGKFTHKPAAKISKKAVGKIAAIDFRTTTDDKVAPEISAVNFETTVDPKAGKYLETSARTDKYLEAIAGPEFVTSPSPVLSEAVIATEFPESIFKASVRTEAMIADESSPIARTGKYLEMIARTEKHIEMIARTDTYLEAIAGPDFVTSPSPVLSEAVIATEFPESIFKPSVRTEAMIANESPVIARTSLEPIARTGKYLEMIARTEKHLEMIARTDKYLEAIAGPEFVTSPSPVLSEAVIAAEFPDSIFKPSVRTEAMIANESPVIARTSLAPIARTGKYLEMIARTEKHLEMIARTDKYLEAIAGPEFVTSPSPVLSEAVIAAEFPESIFKPSVRTEAMIANESPVIARTSLEPIARTEKYLEMIARTEKHLEMIARTDKYLEAIAGPEFVTSPSPVLSEAVIAAEFPNSIFKPSVRTEAMIANESPVIARTSLAPIARTGKYLEMIARTEKHLEMIARTDKYLEAIAGPEFVTSPSPVLSEAVIAAEFPDSILKPSVRTEAMIANESPVIARQPLALVARTEKYLEMIARTEKYLEMIARTEKHLNMIARTDTYLEAIARPDFVTSLSPVLSEAVIATEFPKSILKPSVRTEAMIANESPIIATDIIHPVLSEAVIAPDNPMDMAMYVEGLALSDLLYDASANIRPNVSAYPSTSTVTTTIEPAVGLQHNQLGRLLDSLLIDYDQRLRPRKNQARFVTIFSDFVPQSIIEFNTLLQSFTVMGYFKMDWRDDFLKWDFNDYGDTKYLRIPATSIWIPKLIVDKSRDGYGLVGDRQTDIALIHYRGYVRWFPEGIYSVVCKVSIRFFPFDAQTCTLSYFIDDEDDSAINLKHEDHVDLSEYIENAEWNLINVTSDLTKVDNVHIVNFHFKVERRGGFTMFTLVVPVLLLSMLSGASFLIPIESGEKCGFSVTIFLAYGIFETIVIDTLPHNSLDVSYFIIYLTAMVTVSIILTFYTILQAKVFDMIGAKKFRLMRCSNHGDGISWGTFLQKLDTYVFVVFLVLVLGSTTTFFAVMVEKFHFL